MATNLADIPSFDWDKPTQQAWLEFENHVNLMFDGPLSGKTNKVKSSYLLIWVGAKGREVFTTWSLADNEKDKPYVYLEKFKQHITPQVNLVYSRFQFLDREQNDGEKSSEFVTALKLLAQHCDYDNWWYDGDDTRNLKDEMVRDKIVASIKCPDIKRKLIQKGNDLKLKDAIDLIHAHEAAQDQVKKMTKKQSQPTVEVDAIHTQQRYQHRGQQQQQSSAPRRNQQSLHHNQGNRSSSAQGQSTHVQSRPCYHCGKPYSRDVCDAKGKECYKCHKLGHFKKVCHSPAVNTLEEQEDPNTFLLESIVVDAVADSSTKPYPTGTVLLSLGKEENFCTFKLDTGSQANLISEET